MKKITTILTLFALFQITLNAQDYAYGELADVCDQNNVWIWGEKQPKPKEGIHKIEHYLNRDLKFLVNNPDFSGTVYVENTVSCEGKAGNFNVVVSCENYSLESELVQLLQEIDQWNIGEFNGKPADYWYLWKFKVKKGKLIIKNKKKYYR